MTAATSIVPFQPAQGLPARDALARAHDYIDKLTRKHEALHKTKEAIVSGAKRHGNTFIQSSCTATTAAALGAVNGRFGGEEGLLEKWGVSLDAAVAFAGHVGGFAFSFADNDADPKFDILAEVFHTVGDAGLASGVYRFFHKRGLESQQRANAGAGAAPVVNGAKGGAVYTVAHPK
jgi:hypothetical protein